MAPQLTPEELAKYGAVAVPAPGTGRSTPPVPDLTPYGGVAAPAMNFALVNGQYVPVEPDEPNTFSTFMRKFNEQIDPWEIAKATYHAVESPAAVSQTLQNLGAAQGAVFDKAKAAYQRGDYASAARHGARYAVPMLGPPIDAAIDELERGRYAAGAGTLTGLGLRPVVPAAVAKVGAVAYPAVAHPAAVTAARAGQAGGLLNAQQQAAVRFGQARGIPLDAGTATGHPWIQGIQRVLGESLGGGYVSRRFKLGQAEDFARVGQELAAEAHPAPQSPESAGAGAASALQQVTRAEQRQFVREGRQVGGRVSPHATTPRGAGLAAREQPRVLAEQMRVEAGSAYGELGAIEADPQHVRVVQTAPEGSAAFKRIRRRMAQGTNTAHGPSLEELREMRAILDELDNSPWQPDRRVDDQPGVSSGSTYTYGTANASVYHDLKEFAPSATGTQMRADLAHTLATGEWNQVATSAWEVAKKRLAGEAGRPPLMLGPDVPILGRRVAIGLPVDISRLQAGLRPLYETLLAEHGVTPFVGGSQKGRALYALKTLMEADSVVPASVADAALSELKGFARVETAAARTPGQAIAAKVVSEFHPLVDQAVAAGGTRATAALERGRSATKAKVALLDTWEALRPEGARTYQQLTAADDANAGLLQQLQEVAPAEVRTLARAWFDRAIDKATTKGGVVDAGKVRAQWERLGPTTKELLFGQDAAAIDAWIARGEAAADAALSLAKEPVGAFRQLTLPADSGIARLRQVVARTPQVAREIGRAWIEDELRTATAQGGFDRAKRLRAAWDNLGPETKKILFPDADHRAALGHFFTLADMAALEINPIRSAITGTQAAEAAALVMNPLGTIPYSLGATGMAKVLYSPAGARAFAALVDTFSKPTSSGARAAAVSTFVAVARRQGLAVPAVGDVLRAAENARQKPAQAGGGPSSP